MFLQQIVTQYIFNVCYSKFGNLVAREPYVTLLLIFSLVLLIPEAVSEVFKLTSEESLITIAYSHLYHH